MCVCVCGGGGGVGVGEGCQNTLVRNSKWLFKKCLHASRFPGF